MVLSSADARLSVNRESLVSSNNGLVKANGEYKGMATPVEDIEGGALRAGGAPNLFAKDSIGLLVNYAAVGIVYGAFPSTVYPFLVNYLQMDGYQAEAATALVSLAWSFKTFIGITTDSFPMWGYRRRPYMVLGWSVCFIFLMVMACIPVEEPFFLDYNDRSFNVVPKEAFDKGLVPADFLRNTTHISYEFTNQNAPLSGSKYILMMMFASIGYVVADVAADAVVVEFAQREPEEIRGTTQTMIYSTRFLFNAGANALVGFGMNGRDYGGSFSFAMKFNHVMIILAVATAIVVPCSWWLLAEEKVESESFVDRCRQMWNMVQRRAIWQVMAYTFFSSIFYGLSTTTTYPIAMHWAGVEPLNDNLSSIITSLMIAATLYLMKNYGLNWSWRRTTAITVVLIVAIDSVVMSLTIFDIVRNQWFFLGVPLVTNLPVAINFIIQTYVTVELADPGYEGATYGLMTTVNNLAIPFSTSITKQINAEFDVFSHDIKLDSDHVRKEAITVQLISYASKLFSLVFLVLLPRQKKETQELKRIGGQNKYAGAAALLIAGFALTWGVVTNLMSIFPSTACLKIAGGSGC